MKVGDDFLLSYHGSLWLLIPLSPAGKEWCAAHVAGAIQPPWGGAIVVEPRYVEDITLGILDDGLHIAHWTRG